MHALGAGNTCGDWLKTRLGALLLIWAVAAAAENWGLQDENVPPGAERMPIAPIAAVLLVALLVGLGVGWRMSTGAKRFAGNVWGFHKLTSDANESNTDIREEKALVMVSHTNTQRLQDVKQRISYGLQCMLAGACIPLWPRMRHRPEVDPTVRKRDVWSKGWSPVHVPSFKDDFTDLSTLYTTSSHESDIEEGLYFHHSDRKSFSTEHIILSEVVTIGSQSTLAQRNTKLLDLQQFNISVTAGIGNSHVWECNEVNRSGNGGARRTVTCPVRVGSCTPKGKEKELHDIADLLSPPGQHDGVAMLQDISSMNETQRPQPISVRIGHEDHSLGSPLLGYCSSGGLHQRKERRLSLPPLAETPRIPLVTPRKSFTPKAATERRTRLYPKRLQRQGHPTGFNPQHPLVECTKNYSAVISPKYGADCATSQRKETKIGAGDKEAVATRDRDLDDLLDDDIKRNPALNVDFDNDVVISECLGAGGAGVVYKAFWRGNQVAVKLLLEACQSPEQLHVFYKEVKLLLTLRHPNIVMFLGASMKPPHLCIVQELAEQGSLYQMLHMHHVRPEYGKLLQILCEVASGMSYCHNQPRPVIHRDLKTQNILLHRDGRALIADFGLAKVKERTFFHTKHNAAGTVAYMAPETFGGGPVDEKCDVYSFGVIAWECLTGERPWHGVLPMQIVMAVGVENKRLPIPLRCPKILRELLRQCWHFDPAERPSFSDIESRIKSLLEKEFKRGGRQRR